MAKLHIVKKENVKPWQKILVYAISIFVALLLTGLFCASSSDKNVSVFSIFVSIPNGVLGTERRIWEFLRETALLLGVSLAIIPAFKMKFWNLGANGQVLISCLTSYACMFYLGGKIPQALLVLIMIVACITAGITWAVIPAIFKAFFNTNETLFTLMMNYIATGLVTTMMTVWQPYGSGSLTPSKYGIGDLGNQYILTLLVITLLTVFSYFYLKKSKHGYEISVVGDSENTAKYIGLSVKKVVIRTLIVSGAICGIVGLLITGNINKTVSSDIVNNMGFTAIMTSWLAKFNPLILIGTCALITFVSQGMVQVRKDFGFYNNAIANVVLGVIYFFIIGCEFFLNYKIVLSKKDKQTDKKADFLNTENKTSAKKEVK